MAAAIASWRTALTTARSYRRSLMPRLDVQFLLPEGEHLTVVIRNLGCGVAKAPCIALVVGDAAMFRYLGLGLMAPGTGFMLTTDQPVASDRCMAVVGCRDVDDVFHAWSSDWERRTLRSRWLRRPLRTVDWEEVFASFYPGVGLTGKSPLGYVERPLNDGSTP